jgi:hypothetical protein
MRIRIRNQYCGSVTFWYGSGSADQYHRILLFSSVAFKMRTKNKFFACLLDYVRVRIWICKNIDESRSGRPNNFRIRIQDTVRNLNNFIPAHVWPGRSWETWVEPVRLCAASTPPYKSAPVSPPQRKQQQVRHISFHSSPQTFPLCLSSGTASICSYAIDPVVASIFLNRRRLCCRAHRNWWSGVRRARHARSIRLTTCR